MNATERWIEDVLRGGLRLDGGSMLPLPQDDLSIAEQVRVLRKNVHRLLLMKDAWIAVGKTRGWTETDKVSIFKCNWHEFIHHLADGKTLDQSLSALEE